MQEAILKRLRDDAAKLRTTIEAYKSGTWQTGIQQNGRIIDTTKSDLGLLEGLLISIEDAIAELER